MNNIMHLSHTAMAGNIIPAIATTNACVAGMMVVEALKILAGQFDKCRSVSENKDYKSLTSF